MASTYSDNLKLQLMATGENAGTWGEVTNVNLATALEEAIGGTVDVTFASGTVTLTASDDNTTQQYRHMRLNLIGTSGGAQDLIVPQVQKVYIVNNGCADTITIKTAGQTGVAVPSGKTMIVYNYGGDCVDAITHLTSLTLGSALPVASGGTGSTTATFSGENITSLNASNVSAGTLANARTTATPTTSVATIVSRDGVGDFSGSNITATGSAGFVGVGSSLTALNASSISSGTLDNARTNASSANGASTLVTRDASGDFAANEVTANTFSGTNSTTGNVSISTNTIATTGTDEDLVLSPNGTGAVDVSNSVVVNVSTPTDTHHAATKAYVDNLATNSVSWHTPVRGEVSNSEGNLSATYDNGTSGVGATLTSTVNEAFDYGGISDWAISERVLIYSQTAPAQNGIYTVTTVGVDGVSAWVLTRATDADSFGAGSDALSYGSTVFVREGNGAGESYLCNTSGTITFGTTGITFTQISATAIYTADAATGIDLTGTEFSLGVVPVANGGTGSNTAAFSGANITSLNGSAITSGTVANARTTASSSNGASTIVARDASGNFAANVVTATQVGLDSGDYISWSNNAHTSFFVNGAEEARLEADGDFHADGDVIAYSTTISDRRLKDEITNIAEALDKVGKINGVTFVRKNNGQKSAGVVAQEIMEVLPEAVKEKALPLQTGSEDDLYYVVEYDAITGLLVEAVKELKARVETLEGK